MKRSLLLFFTLAMPLNAAIANPRCIASAKKLMLEAWGPVPTLADPALNKKLQSDLQTAFQEFKKSAKPEHYFDVFEMLHSNALDENQAKRIKAILKESTQKRTKASTSLDKNEAARSAVQAIQELFAKQLPALTGVTMDVDLTQRVRMGIDTYDRRFGFTDPISQQIYLNGNLDPTYYRRIIAHEAVHLMGKHNAPLRLLKADEFMEGMTEYVAIRLFMKAGRLNGKPGDTAVVYPEWVGAVDEQIVGVLLEGNEQPIMDLYQSGDVNQFANVLRPSWDKNGKKLKKRSMNQETRKFMDGVESWLKTLK